MAFGFPIPDVPFDDLPFLFNPPGRYVHNENDEVHHANLEAAFDRADFPPSFPRLRLRRHSQHSPDLVAGDDSPLPGGGLRRKHSYRMLLAETVKDDLVAAGRAARLDGDVAEALALLEQWDGTVAPESRGAVLFEAWWERYEEAAGDARPTPPSTGFSAPTERLFAVPWSTDAPVTTPRGLAEPEPRGPRLCRGGGGHPGRLGRLGRALGRRAPGQAQRPRSPRRWVRRPVGPLPGALVTEDDDGRRRVRGGDGWLPAVEFGDVPRAYSVLAYGQSQREGSLWLGDQLGMFVRGEIKPMAFTAEDVKRATVRRFRPGLPR